MELRLHTLTFKWICCGKSVESVQIIWFDWIGVPGGLPQWRWLCLWASMQNRGCSESLPPQVFKSNSHWYLSIFLSKILSQNLQWQQKFEFVINNTNNKIPGMRIVQNKLFVRLLSMRMQTPNWFESLRKKSFDWGIC